MFSVNAWGIGRSILDYRSQCQHTCWPQRLSEKGSALYYVGQETPKPTCIWSQIQSSVSLQMALGKPPPSSLWASPAVLQRRGLGRQHTRLCESAYELVLKITLSLCVESAYELI